MKQKVVARILAMYGVKYTAILPPQKGYRNASYKIETTGGPLNVIIYKSEPGMQEHIARINALGNFLYPRGGGVRHPHNHRVIRLKTDTGVQKYAALYNYLPGQTIPWEAYTMDHIKALGKAIGDLHAALQSYEGELPSVAAELAALHARMTRYFADPQVIQALAIKLQLQAVNFNFATLLRYCQAVPGQALHMDFVRGNILFDGTQVTGILDFEKAGRGTPALDIARTLAFLLVDCKYKPAAKVTKYFISSGYAKRSASTFTDWQLVGKLVPFFLLHDFYKFLRHNPYEFLPQNEHFTRTKAMLLKHGLIRTAHVK